LCTVIYVSSVGYVVLIYKIEWQLVVFWRKTVNIKELEEKHYLVVKTKYTID